MIQNRAITAPPIAQQLMLAIADSQSPSLESGASGLVEVVPDACHRLARHLATLDVPDDNEDVFLGDLPSDLVGNFYLSLVAICHQTSPVGKPPLEGIVNGRRLTGWDYLLHRYHEQVINDPSLLEPSALAQASGSLLDSLFEDQQYGRRLTHAESRAALLRDLGHMLNRNRWTRADEIWTACHGRIAHGNPNLLAALSGFRAYRDPVCKKSFFFLALMKNSRRWAYSDAESLGPPVDYHEVRGHLRIGTVRIINASLLDKVRSRALVTEEEDVAIRTGVFRAVMLISQLSGLRNPSRLHYLFWNVFRSVCTREAPRCSSTTPPPLPKRYMKILEPGPVIHCPFVNECVSAYAPSPLYEHNSNTDFY